MPVNTLSIALAGLLASAVPVLASTLPAEIEGHNVYSRFLSGAFIPLPAEQTQETVSSPVASPAMAPAVENTPAVLSPIVTAFANPGTQPAVTLQWPSNPTDTDPSDPIIGGGGSIPGRGVGTVPLPGALPMFGLALLSLCGLGIGTRRRVVRANA